MITRRALALTGLAAFAVSHFALAAPPSANDPVAIVNAEISGASDGEPWSIRGMLADSLKS